jgi:hypothetical protein
MATGVPFFQDVFFGPDATRAMGVAFDKVCRSFPGQPRIVQEVIAKRIIDLARDGDSDPDHLCDVALKTLGFGPSSSCST